LLLASQREGMLPISIETAESGQLVAGSVASVTAFGAFIRFLDGVTALAPRTRWPKIYQEDSGPFEIKKGQSILAVVNRVTKAEEGTESKSRVTVSLQPEAVARSLPSSYFLKVNDESEVGTLSAFCSRPTGASVPHVSDAATYLRGILLDEEFALCSSPVRSVVDEDNDDVKTSDIEAIPCRFIYRPGAITKARITSITDQGILLEFPSPTMRLLKQGLGHLSNDQNEKLPSVMGFAISPQQQSTFIEGAIVDVRILDVDAEKSVIVAELLSLTTPKQKKPKRGDLSSPVADELVSRLDAPLLPLAITSLPDVGSIVTARVLQYRKTSNYAVVLLEGSNALAFAATSDFILSSDTLILQEGQNISVVITQVPSSNTTGSTFSSKRKQQVVSTETLSNAVTSTN
jgi:ribosomal protein S1